jgi:hypothetical protein
MNDLKLLGVHPELSDAVISECVSNLTAVAKECRSRNVRVILLEIWPAGKIEPLRRLVWNAAIQQALLQVNEKLKSVSSPENGVRTIAIFPRDGPPLGWYRDALHLRPEAYESATQALVQQLSMAADQTPSRR